MNLTIHLPDKPISDHPPLIRVLWDVFPRGCVPCPMVVNLVDNSMPITMQWQFFIMAIISWMSNAAALFGYKKFACNLKGLGAPNNPRADFINWENTTRTPPAFHKVITMGGAVHAIKSYDETTREYVLESFDGRKPPPLKPEKVYPLRPEKVNIDDYLYTPKTTPWLFYWATIGDNIELADRSYRVRPFPPETAQPVMPFVGDYSNYTEIRIHEALVSEIAANVAIPCPYNPARPLLWAE